MKGMKLTDEELDELVDELIDADGLGKIALSDWERGFLNDVFHGTYTTPQADKVVSIHNARIK